MNPSSSSLQRTCATTRANASLLLAGQGRAGQGRAGHHNKNNQKTGEVEDRSVRRGML